MWPPQGQLRVLPRSFSEVCFSQTQLLKTSLLSHLTEEKEWPRLYAHCSLSAPTFGLGECRHQAPPASGTWAQRYSRLLLISKAFSIKKTYSLICEISGAPLLYSSYKIHFQTEKNVALKKKKKVINNISLKTSYYLEVEGERLSRTCILF